ncbi:E3 ubiquitin-protein ligase RHA1B [Heracleum sosnowskyi]|uniref:E3 ubiquitin-protein ligase RHA1B n=1 Tax=Heracleum sosnowskyi TaxID=360622 RepID=A0AAD8HH57_9APIA|nr:E3 ubiquitin-protein ligase RHA1B [Heracleum sosnowskyi]
MAFLSRFFMSNSQAAQPSLANACTNTTTHEIYEFDWSTSLIPRPLSYTTNTIKNQLPVTEYKSSDNRDDQCAVCLYLVKAKQLTRELENCSHVFHKECIDAWIDKNNVTCPLCRADLLYQNGEGKFKEAKWT